MAALTLAAVVCRVRDHVPWVQSMLPNGMWVSLPDWPAEWMATRLTTRLVCRRCGQALSRIQ